MRLSVFILANIEPILAEWDVFARKIWPGKYTDPAELRDHAENILRAAALDMQTRQTDAQQDAKSIGEGRNQTAASSSVDWASGVHALARLDSGFDLLAVFAEYRALRASVIRLWRDSGPNPDLHDLDDLTRFNESIDQSLTEAVRKYVYEVASFRGRAG